MARSNRGRHERSLTLERLEDRCLLTYTITDLGTLGGPDSYGFGINASGLEQPAGLTGWESDPPAGGLR